MLSRLRSAPWFLAVPLVVGGLVLSWLGTASGQIQTCHGFLDVTYPDANGGNVLVNLTLGAGSITGTTNPVLTINRVRFQLDCDRDAGLGLPCADDGDVMAFGGDATIFSDCFAGSTPVTWSTEHATGSSPNTIVFSASPPVTLVPNGSRCNLSFGITAIGHSNDSTPTFAEEIAGFAQGDAQCSNSLSALEQTNTAIPLLGLGVSLPACFQPLTPPLAPTAPSPPNAQFGEAIATLGSDILVGAPLDDDGAGAAYLFDSSSDFVSVFTFENPDPATSGNFGAAVAAMGSSVIIGAPGGSTGRAYLLDGRTGNRLQTFAQPGPGGGGFGGAVAAVDGSVVVGAPGRSGEPGEVDVFDPTGTVPRLVLHAPAPVAGDGFGSALAGVGQGIVVGAPGAGAAYLFDGSRTVSFQNPSPGRFSEFGAAVAPLGSDVLVGDPGAAMVYSFSGSTGDLLHTFIGVPDSKVCVPGSRLGASLATLPDLVLIGAPDAAGFCAFDREGMFQFDHSSDSPSFGRALATVGLEGVVAGTPDRDRAEVFDLGQGGGLRRRLQTPHPGPLFGASAAVLGDRAAPGDLVVGAPNDADGTGTVYLFRGTAVDGVIGNPHPVSGARFGAAVAAAGSRLLVGAPGDDVGGAGAGAAYVYTDLVAGRASGPPLVVRKATPAANDGFGTAVALLGNDLVVGAPFDDLDGGPTDAGAAYLFDGTTGTQRLRLQAPAPATGAYFGAAVAVAAGNAIVGAPFDRQGAGAVYVFDGTTGAFLRALAVGGTERALFGASLATVGADQVLIGAPLDDVLGALGILEDAGQAYLMSTTTGALLHVFNAPVPQARDQFGFSVAGMGADALIGAPLEEPGGTIIDSGKVFLFGLRDDGQWAVKWAFPNPILADLAVTDPGTAASRQQFGSSIMAAGDSVLVGAARGSMAYLFGPCATSAAATTVAVSAPTTTTTVPPLADPLALACAGGYCDDHNPCTADFCSFGGCTHQRIPDCHSGGCSDDASCQDGSMCNGVETCEECLGCFLHVWTCCGRGTKCAGGALPEEGTACDVGVPCALGTGICSAAACVCRPCPQCDDHDSCTDDGCTATACVHAAKTGYAAALCRREQPLPSQCAGQRVPAKVKKLEVRAYRLIAKASGAKRSRQARRLLKKGGRLLGEAARKLDRLGRRRAGSLACFSALAALDRDAGNRASVLADTI